MNKGPPRQRPGLKSLRRHLFAVRCIDRRAAAQSPKRQRREREIQKKDLARLHRILGLLGSEHAGERASAAAAAITFLKKHDLSWTDVLDGGALVPKPKRNSTEIGIDYLEAAESRIRQLKTHNAALELQVSRLKAQIEGLKEKRAMQRDEVE